MSWDERAAADKLAFIHCTPVGPQATLLLGTLQKLGVSRVAVVNELQQGSMRMEREIKELAPQYGISVEAIRTNPGETDFRTVVLKLKQKHPQAYVSLVLPPAFQNYYTAARQLDPDAIFTAVEGFSYVSDASPYEGCFYVAGNEATPEFAQKFTSATGKPAITFCGNAYDMIDMVINATEHAGAKLGHKPTSAEIAGELYTLRDYPGAVGNLTMGPNRVVQSPAVLKTIKNGKAQLTDFAEIQKSLRR
jgi:ABC-type branched-subunit amino acid transport system substrate-binding protein